MIAELSVEKLRKRCNPQGLGCASSDEVGSLQAIVGQERAVRALRFGLGIKDKGFNIYVNGLPGTGRTTAVRRFLEETARQAPTPPDWCYVNNFKDPYRPYALRLPAGKATDFKADIENLVRVTTRDIRSAFESEEYAADREQTVKTFQQQKNEILERLNQEAQNEGFLLKPTPMGLISVPLHEGKPLTEEEFLTIGQEVRDEIARRQQNVNELMETTLRQVRGLDRSAQEALQKLDQEVALYIINNQMEHLKPVYKDLPEVLAYLEQVQKDMLAHISDFKAEPEEAEAQLPFPIPTVRKVPVRKYAVNVLVDNSNVEGAPVILERNPTYGHLFGRIEQEAQFGVLTTDFTLIRRGSLHRANGGFLVLPVEDLLVNPLSWDNLKRALENQEITIEDVGERLGLAVTKSLRPEPIPLDVKVVLIGRPDVYHALLAYDEKFNELFKVKADFDTQIPRTQEHLNNYVAFVSTLCTDGNLRHLDASALSRIVEYGSRLAEDQEKLSARFGEIANVIREANHYAGLEDAHLVTGAHVRKAIEEQHYRSSLIQERVQEMISRGVIKIDVNGSEVGQVNGISVFNMGDITFGQPNRITVSVGLGHEGLIDIEREARLAGPIHTKGVMILSGYLAAKYTQDKPLNLSARLVFEQSYSDVEGDSASSTELYAILSALSGLPIKQGIAVTGSINQKGEVQAIGGVNEKIEGFFEVCRMSGLNGEHGVIIPESNVTNLMLKEEVVEAVEKGKFHIWAVKTIDDGIEILTGVPAGQWQEDGSFEEGSVNDRVDKRLKEMAMLLLEFGKDKVEKQDKEEEEEDQEEDRDEEEEREDKE